MIKEESFTEHALRHSGSTRLDTLLKSDRQTTVFLIDPVDDKELRKYRGCVLNELPVCAHPKLEIGAI